MRLFWNWLRWAVRLRGIPPWSMRLVAQRPTPALLAWLEEHREEILADLAHER